MSMFFSLNYDVYVTLFDLVTETEVDPNYLNRQLELSNVEIIVADISKFEMETSFDRVVSIEMFEVI